MHLHLRHPIWLPIWLHLPYPFFQHPNVLPNVLHQTYPFFLNFPNERSIDLLVSCQI
jgi:hypothetical protein